MADNVTTQSATLATAPTATTIATYDLGSGRQAQVVLTGGSATSSVTSVSAAATSTSILASNAGRLGASLYNDSASFANVKLGATASSTSFTVRMSPGGYYEVPFFYRGAIDAIWDSATGAMRVTELT